MKCPTCGNWKGPQELIAGTRLGLQHSEFLGSWWISHNPRNDSSHAEGDWQDWVALAKKILVEEKARNGANVCNCTPT